MAQAHFPSSVPGAGGIHLTQNLKQDSHAGLGPRHQDHPQGDALVQVPLLHCRRHADDARQQQRGILEVLGSYLWGGRGDQSPSPTQGPAPEPSYIHFGIVKYINAYFPRTGIFSYITIAPVLTLFLILMVWKLRRRLIKKVLHTSGVHVPSSCDSLSWNIVSSSLAAQSD